MHYVPGRRVYEFSTSVSSHIHTHSRRARFHPRGSRPFAHAHQKRERESAEAAGCCCWIREYLIRRAETRNFTPSSVAYPKDLLQGKGITHPTVGSVCPSLEDAARRSMWSGERVSLPILRAYYLHHALLFTCSFAIVTG